MNLKKIPWRYVGAAWIAFVFIQSLFFKFTGSYETEHIFGTLAEWSGLVWFGVYGAYMVGVMELIASIILFTRVWPWGALLANGIMSGAIFFHLFTPLGIPMPVFDAQGQIVESDGGLLFVMACITWTVSAVLVFSDIKSKKSILRRATRSSRGAFRVMSDAQVENVLTGCRQTLLQEKILLESLEETQYANAHNPLVESSIGQHIRHIHDLWFGLLSPLKIENGKPALIDYDLRRRGHPRRKETGRRIGRITRVAKRYRSVATTL